MSRSPRRIISGWSGSWIHCAHSDPGCSTGVLQIPDTQHQYYGNTLPGDKHGLYHTIPVQDRASATTAATNHQPNDRIRQRTHEADHGQTPETGS